MSAAINFSGHAPESHRQLLQHNGEIPQPLRPTAPGRQVVRHVVELPLDGPQDGGQPRAIR